MLEISKLKSLSLMATKSKQVRNSNKNTSDDIRRKYNIKRKKQSQLTKIKSDVDNWFYAKCQDINDIGDTIKYGITDTAKEISESLTSTYNKIKLGVSIVKFFS